jgi:hypothetical protein
MHQALEYAHEILVQTDSSNKRMTMSWGTEQIWQISLVLETLAYVELRSKLTTKYFTAR